jgi:hypothetical protein
VKQKAVALLDACVLIPMPLADTLLRLAAGPHLYVPKWSDRIMVEADRTLQENFGLSPEKTAYRESEIRRHFPEAWVEGYEALIPVMTNHPKDHHVLAAAVRARAGTIVTYNVKDFPVVSLAPYSITVAGPSAFPKKLYELAPLEVMETLEHQAAAIGQSLGYLLARLRINAPGFVALIEEKGKSSGEPDAMGT